MEIQANLDLAENNVRLSLFGENIEEIEELKKKKFIDKFENIEDFDEQDEFFDRTLKK